MSSNVINKKVFSHCSVKNYKNGILSVTSYTRSDFLLIIRTKFKEKDGVSVKKNKLYS